MSFNDNAGLVGADTATLNCSCLLAAHTQRSDDRLRAKVCAASTHTNTRAHARHNNPPTRNAQRTHWTDTYVLVDDVLLGGAHPACAPAVPLFAVYDGHGGGAAARHCASRLHTHVAARLTALLTDAAARGEARCPLETDAVGAALRAAFLETDRELGGCAGGGDGGDPQQPPQPPPQQQQQQQQHEFRSNRYSGEQPPQPPPSPSPLLREPGDAGASGGCGDSGSTALVALLTPAVIWLAWAGDSRAVLVRDGKAAAATSDHRPGARDDERRRIEAAGGVLLNNGGLRLMGMLATTRAIGDHDLQAYGLTPEPEVMALPRRDDDEFLVLATDGLWDKVAPQEAAALAHSAWARVAALGRSCSSAHAATVEDSAARAVSEVDGERSGGGAAAAPGAAAATSGASRTVSGASSSGGAVDATAAAPAPATPSEADDFLGDGPERSALSSASASAAEPSSPTGGSARRLSRALSASAAGLPRESSSSSAGGAGAPGAGVGAAGAASAPRACRACKAARIAASAMSRCARNRRSRDDTTVLVVNLQQPCRCASSWATVGLGGGGLEREALAAACVASSSAAAASAAAASAVGGGDLAPRHSGGGLGPLPTHASSWLPPPPVDGASAVAAELREAQSVPAPFGVGPWPHGPMGGVAPGQRVPSGSGGHGHPHHHQHQQQQQHEGGRQDNGARPPSLDEMAGGFAAMASAAGGSGGGGGGGGGSGGGADALTALSPFAALGSRCGGPSGGGAADAGGGGSGLGAAGSLSSPPADPSPRDDGLGSGATTGAASGAATATTAGTDSSGGSGGDGQQAAARGGNARAAATARGSGELTACAVGDLAAGR